MAQPVFLAALAMAEVGDDKVDFAVLVRWLTVVPRSARLKRSWSSES